MESFFFIPGDRLHKISDIRKLNVSQVIIDLEDAVKVSEREYILKQLIDRTEYSEYYIRVPLYNIVGALDTHIFSELYKKGFRKFVFPKIQKASDFDIIITERDYSEVLIILLIETAGFFIEAKEVLFKYRNIFTGIGLGSHDLMAEIGGIHNLNNLEYLRLQILYLARAIKILAIDIACMELNSSRVLEEEILDGLEKGYDAKFFIHPWQISILKSILLYSDEELNWAQKVQKELEKVDNESEFNPIIIDGQIIERPHLAKAKKIIKYYETK